MARSLQERLVAYLKARPNQRIAKAAICDLAREKMGVTGETVGRRLRVLAEVSQWGYRPIDTPEHRTGHELLEGGKVNVIKVDGHAHYWYEPAATHRERRVRIVDGVAQEYYETITTQS
jgi:hypothetical protein